MTDANRRDPACFGPLAEFDVPSLPTRDMLQITLSRARDLLKSEPAKPMIASTRLQRSTLDIRASAAAPPAYGPLIEELQASLSSWLAENEPAERTRLIVLPPGDRERLVASWADRHGHAVLDAPARAAIVGAHVDDLPSLSGEGVLVIPALEDWFIRHHDGLTLVRALLARLHRTDRMVVVGCNSWAWQYLARAVQADAVLSAPIIFGAFDAERLRAWFARLAGEGQALRFLEPGSGDNVLALDDNAQPDNVMISLAARSRGIPWIAWRLWRSSLHRHIPETDDPDLSESRTTEAVEPHAQRDGSTLWVSVPDEFSLPGRDNDDSLLILQTLLIHGALAPERLAETVPFNGAGHGLPALIGAGIVEHDDDGRLVCAPTAYPAIRTALTTAGFPIAAV